MFIEKSKIYKQFLTAIFSKISCLVLLLLISQPTLAKTLDEYQDSVQTLQAKFQSIASNEDIEESIKEVFDQVSKKLPVEEEIEAGNSSIKVNNEWLKIEIAKYKSEKDDAEKKRIIKAISERLDAILIKIKELKTAKDSRASKDEEKRRLAEILRREEFQKATTEDKSLFQRFLEWIDELFKRNAPKQQPLNIPKSNFGGFIYIFQLVLYGLVIALIGFLIYKFSPFLLKKFRDREKREKKERIILGEKISSDETSENLFKEAEELAEEGNLRDAIRKGYISLLFELSERKLIGLAKHKTNRDYLKSIRKKPDLYKSMDDLTLNYERHWYGFDDADESDWQRFREHYKQALK